MLFYPILITTLIKYVITFDDKDIKNKFSYKSSKNITSHEIV
jgi:hypothetical protein